MRSASPRLTLASLLDLAAALAITVLDPLHSAHFSRSGTRVGLNFTRGRDDRFFAKQLYFLAPAASASQHSRRTETCTVPFTKLSLYDAILQRMKGNNRHSPSGSKHFVTALQEPLELLQFLVHGDAQRLEYLRCRMVIAPPTSF